MFKLIVTAGSVLIATAAFAQTQQNQGPDTTAQTPMQQTQPLQERNTGMSSPATTQVPGDTNGAANPQAPGTTSPTGAKGNTTGTGGPLGSGNR